MSRKEELPNAYVEGPKEVRVPVAPAVICPLCKLPITVDDAVGKNMDTVTFNGQQVQVHKTCPTEKR